MRTIKKLNIKYVAISVIIGIMLLLFITTKITKCSSDHTGNIITDVERSTIRKHIIDSVLSEQATRDVYTIDSINKIRDKERASLSVEINKEKIKTQRLIKERDALLNGYIADTLSQSDKCNDIIEKDGEIISSQQITISKLETDTTILSFYLNDTKKKYFIEVDNHNRTKDINLICKQNQELLIKELQKQNTWWRRNEKWIYFGAGLIVPIAIATTIR